MSRGHEIAPAGVTRYALSRGEAAFMAGVSPGTFDRMVADGSMPPARTYRTRKMWLKVEIERALLELPEEEAATDDPWAGAT